MCLDGLIHRTVASFSSRTNRTKRQGQFVDTHRLFAVVIAAGATDSAGGENSKLSPEDADIMGVMLICSDVACMACSFFAMIACVLLLRRSILAAKREEKAQEEEEQEAPEFGIHSINRKLNRHSSLMKKMSATAIMPQVHRRESLRNEGNAAHKGLHAMFEHANDHLKKKSPFGMLGKGGKKTIRKALSHTLKNTISKCFHYSTKVN